MSTAKSKSALPRRFSQVYVEIPPSPLHRARGLSNAHTLKENVIFNPSQTTPLKRKQPGGEFTTSTTATKVKKQKLDLTKTTDPSEDYPNGHAFCHQCSRKQDVAEVVLCTFARGPSGKSCPSKYCKACLKNRYGEDAVAIKAQKEFKCPRCRDICNCWKCRKAKGLAPTGNLHFIARQTGVASAAQVLLNNPTVAVVLGGLKATNATAIATATTTTKRVPAINVNSVHTKEPRAKPNQKPEPLPIVHWSLVPRTRHLTLKEVEDRVQIREFMMRFCGITGFTTRSRHILNELEKIAGAKTTRNDNEWVSESCLKAIVIALLGLLSDGDGDKEHRKMLKVAISDIQRGSAALTKMWGVLSALRNAFCDSKSNSTRRKDSNSENYSDEEDNSTINPTLTFPDPLPPTTTDITVHYTRSTRTSTDSTFAKSTSKVSVISTAQMVPVVVGLIDDVLRYEHSGKVREEIERGMGEAKNWRKLAREKEALLKGKQKDEKEKEKENANTKHEHEHDENLSDKRAVETALRILTTGCSPRFDGRLGRDKDGRTYFVLSPGFAERAHAEGVLDESRKGKGQNGMADDQRHKMKKWSWFVGVYGKRPEEGVLEGDEDDSDDEDEDEEDEEEPEKWWGFHDPGEIRKLAEWVDLKSGLDSVESPEGKVARKASSSDKDICKLNPETPDEEVKGLVAGLREYANVLDWRIRHVQVE